MIIREMIEDLEDVLKESDSVKDYDIAVAAYDDVDPSEINITYIGAFYSDENRHFFLVPVGAETFYGLESEIMTAGGLLKSLKSMGYEALSYKALVRVSTDRLKDGSIASLSKPLWATGIHDDAQLVYFCFGDQPST